MSIVVQAEELSVKDRSELHQTIAVLKQSYVDRLRDVQQEYHQAQRQVNRLEHELHRLEKHLERINQFCEHNDITLEEE